MAESKTGEGIEGILTRGLSKSGPRLKVRLLAYLAVWILAAVVIQIFLGPDGSEMSKLPELVQRIVAVPWTPVCACVGLASWGEVVDVSEILCWFVAITFLVNAVLVVVAKRWPELMWLIGWELVQAMAGVMLFIKWTGLSHGE